MFDNPNFSDLVLSARSCSYSKESAIVSDYNTSTSCTLTFAEVAVYIDLSTFHIFRQIPPGFRSKTLWEIAEITQNGTHNSLPCWGHVGDTISRQIVLLLDFRPPRDMTIGAPLARDAPAYVHITCSKWSWGGYQPVSLHSFSSHAEEERLHNFQQLLWEGGIYPTVWVFHTDTAVHSMQGCWNSSPPAKQY